VKGKAMNWVTRFSLIALLCGTVLLLGDSIQTPKNPAYPAATSWRFDAPIQINPTTCVIKYKVSLLAANDERLKSFDTSLGLVATDVTRPESDEVEGVRLNRLLSKEKLNL
jgi:hypothetical protein